MDTADTPTAAQVAASGRGPGYPGLSLEEAIQRARQLQDIAGRNAAPLAAAADAWGYTPKSSNNLKIAAALKRFGLATDVGDGQARMLQLTDAGRQILFHEEDKFAPEWTRLVREAALKPNVYRELLDRFSTELPNDRIIEHYLDFDLGYSESAAKELIKKFRATIKFAGVEPNAGSVPRATEDPDDRGVALDPAPRAVGSQPTAPPPDDHPGWAWIPSVGRWGKILPETDADGGLAPEATAVDAGVARTGAAGKAIDAETLRGWNHLMHSLGLERDASAPTARWGVARRSVSIPYSADEWATIEAPFPVTGAQWDAMMTMLAAMKPGLTREPSTASSADSVLPEGRVTVGREGGGDGETSSAVGIRGSSSDPASSFMAPTAT